MSWDIGVAIDTGANEPHEVSWRNVTWNVSPLFRHVLPGSEGLAAFHGAPCSEAGGVLLQAARRLDAMSDEEALSLVRGGGSWGSRETALADLRWLAGECSRHPKATIYVR